MENKKLLLQKIYKLWTYYPHMELCRLISLVNDNKIIDFVNDKMLENKLNAKLKGCEDAE